jgi:hypothetical protein
MYFAFNSDLKTWRNKPLIARSEPLLADCEPHWWLAQPLTKKPDRFKFFIPKNGQRLDNYCSGSEIDMYSQKIIDIISDHGVCFESFPADVFDAKSGELLSSDGYRAFHLLEIRPSVDLGKSTITRIDRGELPTLSVVKPVVLYQEILDCPKPLFRMEDFFNHVLIHQSLRDSFDKAGITGCKYTPIDEIKVQMMDE